MAMMERRKLIVRFGVVALLVYARAGAEAPVAATKQAEQAVAAWLPVWDAGKTDETYDRLAEQTKKDVSLAQWVGYWTSVRKPLGAVRSRKLLKAEYIESLPTIPDRAGAMLQYETEFENRAHAIETIGMRLIRLDPCLCPCLCPNQMESNLCAHNRAAHHGIKLAAFICGSSSLRMARKYARTPPCATTSRPSSAPGATRCARSSPST